MRAVRIALALVAVLAAASPALADEDIASLGLREDGGTPLAALRLKLPDTLVIVQAPVTGAGGRSIEIRRQIAPNVSLGGTYQYHVDRTLVSDRFGLKLTISR